MIKKIKMKEKRRDMSVKPIIGAPVIAHNVDRFADNFDFTVATKDIVKLQDKSRNVNKAI